MVKNDASFDILMKLVVNKCMEDEIALFNSLDTSEVNVSSKTNRKIRNAIKLTSLRKSVLFKATKFAATAILTAVTIVFSTAMCIQPIRAAFWTAIVQWYENYIGIRYEINENDYPKIIEKKVVPKSLPDGWTIEVLDECDISVNYLIFGINGEAIYYEQKIVNTEEIWFNNKECVVEKVSLNNIEAYVYSYFDNLTDLIWKDEYVFILSGEQVSKETLIQIAETMQ